jgi:hypothetical protein
LRHAAGQIVADVEREPDASAVMMIPIPRRGVLKRVEGTEQAAAVPLIEEVRITAKPDQLLEPLPEAGSYLGFIFARGPRAGDVDEAVRIAQSRLRLTIDPPIDLLSA